MEYKCKVCNKQYKTYQSLWNHNKKFHKNINQPTSAIVEQTSANISANDILLSTNEAINTEQNKKHYCCRKCNKSYNHIQSRWKHEQKCKHISTIPNIISDTNSDLKILQETTKQKQLELEYKKAETILKKEEAKILQLKLKLQNSNKVDNITLKKLNKILLDRHNRIKNSTVNSHNNNTINVQNNITNYQLIGFGKEENIHHILTPQEKRSIVNSRYCSLEKIIEIVHCGRYSQFKNVIVTNMKDNYMYKYDDKKGMFVLSNKKDVLNMLVNYRMGDLEIIYNELLENNRIDERTKTCIEKFVNEINYNNEKFKNTDGTVHENYRQYKINEIKVLLFNNQDKIMGDISLLLSTEETEPENTIIGE